MKDGKSATRRTAEILLQIMNSIMPFLRFTLEIGEEFSDQKLPTLDVKFWVEGGKLILHDFFEKPMSTNLVLHAKTAHTVNILKVSEPFGKGLPRTFPLQRELKPRFLNPFLKGFKNFPIRNLKK